MKHILSVKQVRNSDLKAIRDFGIPSVVLMENAARSTSDYLIKILNESKIFNPVIKIFCGSGNNGGDGFALARHLYNNLSDTNIIVYWIGSIDKMSDETETNYFSMNQIGIKSYNISNEEEIELIDFNADIIIDSILGVGGSENLRGLIVPILKKINNIDCFKLAVDVPTGLNSDNGLVDKNAFIADATVTMFAPKKGMYLNNGKKICGDILIADLGAPEKIVKKESDTKILETEDLRKILPYRDSYSNKFDYGKALIIAGNKNMPGAAAMTANACNKSGAGLTFLNTKNVHSSVSPEIITNEFSGDYFNIDDIQKFEDIDKFDVIAIGPGLGNKNETLEFVKKIVGKIGNKIPLVIDADALKSFSNEDELNKNIILTPHIGEFANLIGKNREEIYHNVHEIVKETAKKMNCIIHLKYHPSITTDGNNSYWQINSNAGLASGGSGDTLTGIISALIAQKVEPLEAVALSAFIHQLAADISTEQIGEEALTTNDILNSLNKIFNL